MPETLLISCPNCGAANRVPEAKLSQGLHPVCGRCKTPLPEQAGLLTITDANFGSHVEQSDVPVLVDMWAPWCGPCHMIAPVIEQIALEMNGKLRVGKMNIDENQFTAERYQIRSIPALLVFKSGQLVDRMIGAQPKTEILRRLAAVL